MPTPLQERLADAIIENTKLDKPKTMGEMLESAGYAQGTAEGSPGRTIEQDGVKVALIAKGFTVDRADEVVAEILNTGEERNRLKAADMIYERHGAKAPTKSLNFDMKVEVDPTQLHELLVRARAISESIQSDYAKPKEPEPVAE